MFPSCKESDWSITSFNAAIDLGTLGRSNVTGESNCFNRICIKNGIRNRIEIKGKPRSNASLSVIDVSGRPVMTSKIGEYLKNNQYIHSKVLWCYREWCIRFKDTWLRPDHETDDVMRCSMNVIINRIIWRFTNS